jgi:hypothetical protein
MPHDYDLQLKRFRTKGRTVSRLKVRSEINKLTQHVGKESAKIAKELQSKSISVAEFEIRMRELLKSAHIVSASVGKGGRALMTQADWGRVGAKIKWQYGYLNKFARKIAQGSISEVATIARARSYSSSVFVSFYSTFKDAQTTFVEDGKNPEQCRLVTNSEEGCVECAADEAEGWMSIDDMGEIGSRICGDFCRCDIIFSDDPEVKDFNIKLSVELD